MGKRKNTALETAELYNDLTFADYCDRLKRIAMSRFEWKNLPSSMDERYLEHCLFYTGNAALLKHPEYGFINTKATISSSLNLYGLPTKIKCNSYGIINEDRFVYYNKSESVDEDNYSEAVLVRNDWEGEPTSAIIELFAQRLTEADRSCDVNIKAQKTPYVVLTSDAQRLSMTNAFQQVDANSAVIVGNKDQFDINNIRALSTQAPYVTDKIMIYKQQIWNEILTILGVNNLSEKRERLISDETNTNNELINLNLMSFLKPREKAANQFNEMFGLTGDKAVSVQIRSDLDNIIKRSASVVVDQYADQVITEELIKDGNFNIKESE